MWALGDPPIREPGIPGGSQSQTSLQARYVCMACPHLVHGMSCDR